MITQEETARRIEHMIGAAIVRDTEQTADILTGLGESLGPTGMYGVCCAVAEVGKGCLIGANALITEGKEFPDDSLIMGSPAKAVRTLDAESAARLRASATNYVANAARFRKGLRRVDQAG